MENFAVIDFETMGMSPGEKVRAVSVSLAVVKDGQVVERFHSLMNSGVLMPEDAEMLTGITSEMLAEAPHASVVMQKAFELSANSTLVAHNAPFHQAFWLFEMERAGLEKAERPFLCTQKLAQRLYPKLQNHSLSSLHKQLGLSSTGTPGQDETEADRVAQLYLHLQPH